MKTRGLLCLCSPLCLAFVPVDPIILVLNDRLRVQHGKGWLLEAQRKPGPLIGRSAAIGKDFRKPRGKVAEWVCRISGGFDGGGAGFLGVPV